MNLFSLLPEGCISEILSVTSPRDACRLSAISWGFKSAADSDVVWHKFLPSDYQQIISRSLSPVVYSTKKQLYLALCDSPILLDGGKLSFALDKETGKKCCTLPARELSIAWGDDPRYWAWISLPESRFSEVARLRALCLLGIVGKMKTATLSPNTTYAAYLIFKTVGKKYSEFEALPLKVSVRFVADREDIRGAEDEDCNYSTACFRLGEFRAIHGEHTGRFPRKRKDGWSETELGEFVTNDRLDDGEVEMRLRERKNLSSKSGLVVEGFELRPKDNAKTINEDYVLFYFS